MGLIAVERLDNFLEQKREGAIFRKMIVEDKNVYI